MLVWHQLGAWMSSKGYCTAYVQGSSVASEYRLHFKDVCGSPRIVVLITWVAIPCGLFWDRWQPWEQAVILSHSGYDLHGTLPSGAWMAHHRKMTSQMGNKLSPYKLVWSPGVSSNSCYIITPTLQGFETMTICFIACKYIRPVLIWAWLILVELIDIHATTNGSLEDAWSMMAFGKLAQMTGKVQKVSLGYACRSKGFKRIKGSR